MSLLHTIGVLCLTIPAAIGANADYSNLLFRRDDYIDASGDNSTVQLTVALNNLTLINQSKWDSFNADIRIPHTSLVATGFNLGGGPGQMISEGTFEGRFVGRGSRNEIYGTARYGSGYGLYSHSAGGTVKYTPFIGLDVSNRNFPHGFPPISFGNYSGGGEYHRANQSELAGARELPYPSGPVVGLPSDHTMGMGAEKFGQVWFILGEGATLDLLYNVLSSPGDLGGCDSVPWPPEGMATISARSWMGTDNGTLEDGDVLGYSSLLPTDTGLRQYAIFPWNVVQYYRGSSIALASTNYTNTFAMNGNQNADYWASTPLNTTGVDMDFLKCLNQTIAAAIPIVDPKLIIRSRPNTLTGGQIAGIVIGSVVGVGLIAGVGFWYRKRRTGTPAGKGSI